MIKRIVDVLLIKFFPNLFAAIFIGWLSHLQGEDRKLATDFIKARATELASIRVMHISAVGNLIARNIYVDLYKVLEDADTEPDLQMNIKNKERRSVFAAIAVHIESTVGLGRRLRRYQGKRVENLSATDQWHFERDRIYLQHILGQ